jgi:hypothetical protein
VTIIETVQDSWQALIQAEQQGAPLAVLEQMYDHYLLLADATQRDDKAEHAPWLGRPIGHRSPPLTGQGRKRASRSTTTDDSSRLSPQSPELEREAPMQHTEHEDQQSAVAPADPQSQPLPPPALVQQVESDDPEQIFLRAVAEIDTQPLTLPRKRVKLFWQTVLELLVCLEIVGSLVGLVYGILTYPHTLVILYATESSASLTATLAVLTRPLAPVTLSRSATAPTTGHGHQEARAASGILTFYNGTFAPQAIPVGTVVTGADGVKVATLAALTVPAAQPPQFATASVAAVALTAGNSTNIAAGDIDTALSSALLAKNLSAFTGGRDARSYQAVASHDLILLTSTVNDTLAQAFPTAFPLQPGEQVLPTQCHSTTTANPAVNAEATSVTVTMVKTCSAVAYDRQQVAQQATAAFSSTRPAASYHTVGRVQTTVQRVSPFSVTISGRWVYTFSPDYEQVLAEHIAGDSPAKAQAYLLKTGVISYATIPSPLPPDAMYINFVVLVG